MACVWHILLLRIRHKPRIAPHIIPVKLNKEGQPLYIEHTHPTTETPEEKAEALSVLYCACVRKLCGAKMPWALPQHSSPVPNAQ